MLGRTLTLAPRVLTNTQSARGMASLNANAKALMKTVFSPQVLNAIKTELRPPTPAEIPRAIKDLTRLFKERNWKNVTIRDAWLNTLVTTEVICWFFVGEVIGKGTVIGYQV